MALRKIDRGALGKKLNQKVNITVAEEKTLAKAVMNYVDTLTDPNETKSCLLKLDELRALLRYIDEKNLNIILNHERPIEGVRIYLVRENPVREASTYTKGQIDFAIVPITGYYLNQGKGGDDFCENEKIICLFPGGETSGLCPDNC